MRIYSLIISILLICISYSYAEAPILSNDAQISLLTCSPGNELYSLFGHSAMRVKDEPNDIDVVFNYGTFSFDEDFYFNFTMGRLNYKLSLGSMEGFVRSYEYEGRGIIEQVLDLDSAQRQRVFEYLDWNYQPENRFYLYDFFYDNCSSRLRDVLDSTLADDGLTYADLLEPSHPSFRNIIDRYLVYHPWGDFGIDLGLGLPCDRVPTSNQYMFLPDKLLEAFDAAQLGDTPLVREKSEILPAQGLEASFSLTQPIPLMWIFFGLMSILSAFGMRKGRLLRGLDVTLLSITGLLGALIFFLWFITDHNGTAGNLNILWAWPIHLLCIPLLFFEKTRRWFWMLYGGVLLLTLISFPILPQLLHLATIPIMMTGIMRAFVNLKLRSI